MPNVRARPFLARFMLPINGQNKTPGALLAGRGLVMGLQSIPWYCPIEQSFSFALVPVAVVFLVVPTRLYAFLSRTGWAIS